ncbi:MAG: MBL fold metallo-hydrolase [Dialister hominis]|jgi:flavorubredoxin|uniref:FprA family A-type flavoprotein n=1 Tax=Dialister hominis TaxID=2582419 RepID=UPI00300F4AAB
MHNEQQVTTHIYWVGGNDFNSPRFENLIPLKSGVTYNSYFIDDEKTAVIDTTDTVIRDLFIGNVSHLLHGRKLDYIVVNHMEPDHSGSLLALAMAYPEAKIVASAQALKMLGQYFQVSMPERYITSDEKLVIDLGMHKLRFLKAPMVHWPEVTFTYDETEKVLFTADGFGTFGILNGSIFADDVDYKEEYLGECRKYYANIVARFGPQVLSALKKVDALDVRYICSLHGPVIRRKEDIDFLIGEYKKWASWTPDYQSVNIFIASAYGNTAMAAEVLAAKLAKRGIRNLKMVDVCTVSLADSFTEILRRSHIVLAASTMNMTVNPLMSAFLAICTEMNVTNRKVSIIGNSSWTPNVSGQLMKDVVSKWKNCELLGDPVHIVSSMHDDDADIEKLADIIAEDILKEK